MSSIIFTPSSSENGRSTPSCNSPLLFKTWKTGKVLSEPSLNSRFPLKLVDWTPFHSKCVSAEKYLAGGPRGFKVCRQRMEARRRVRMAYKSSKKALEISLSLFAFILVLAMKWYESIWKDMCIQDYRRDCHHSWAMDDLVSHSGSHTGSAYSQSVAFVWHLGLFIAAPQCYKLRSMIPLAVFENWKHILQVTWTIHHIFK